MRMGQGVRTGLGHGGITCVLQTQFSSLQNIKYALKKIILQNSEVTSWKFHYVYEFQYLIQRH